MGQEGNQAVLYVLHNVFLKTCLKTPTIDSQVVQWGSMGRELNKFFFKGIKKPNSHLSRPCRPWILGVRSLKDESSC